MLGKLRNMTSVYLMQEGKMLLLYRQGGRVVSNVYTGSAGGHFEEDELNDAKACVLREMREELSLTEDALSNLRFKYVTLRYTNGEIRQNYYFFADLRPGAEAGLKSNEGTLRWVTFEEAITLDMPFTAKYVVAHYIKTGRYDEKIYGGITNHEGVIFTELPVT